MKDNNKQEGKWIWKEKESSHGIGYTVAVNLLSSEWTNNQTRLNSSYHELSTIKQVGNYLAFSTNFRATQYWPAVIIKIQKQLF